jgi:Predicted peptidase
MRLKFIFALAVVCGLSFSQLHAQQTAKITSSGIGYLEYLPQGYASNSNDYPIVIFLHGIGEKGTTSTDPTTLKNSVQKVANVGLPKYVKSGKQYPFILISPQLKGSYGTWPANYVMDVLNHVKKYLRVNERRIYITGLSLGGFGTWTTLGAYPETFASAVAICSGGNALSKACAIAAENIPLWGFHGTADNIVHYSKTTSMIDAINACTPKPSPLAKVTLFSGANHIIWDRVYNDTDAINWMLGFTNGVSASSSTTNNPPVVSAGGDKSITLPTNEVYIHGTASDNDGSIASYKWTKVSGGSASLGAATTSKLRAYNLVQGTYVFRLTATDNQGAIKSDDVKVTVNPVSTTNIPPVAYAGTDKSTSSSSYTIVGSGTDKDGEIVSYKWVQTYGPAVTMTNTNTSKLTLSGMKDGKYFFKLVVTDDKGATDEDHMHVVVSGSASTASLSSSANLAPVVSAGIDRTTSATSIMIYGSAMDKDGKIASYRWTQYGGAAATLSNATTPTLTVKDLRDGKYYFRLAATDDGGATGFDNMLLTVNRSTSTSSVRRVTSDAILQNDVTAIMVTDLEIGRYSMKLRGLEDDITTDPDNAINDVNES